MFINRWRRGTDEAEGRGTPPRRLSWRHRSIAVAAAATLIAPVLALAAPASALPPLAGSIYALGDNTTGELGNASGPSSCPSGSASQSTTPVATNDTSGLATVSVAAGSGFSLALKQDGTVWAWGRDDVGQAGVATCPGNLLTGAPAVVAVPAKVNFGTTSIKAIAAGTNFALALDAAGNVWAWGDNSKGELGLNPSAFPSSSTPQKISFPSGIVIQSIAAGGNFALALDNSGTNGTSGNVWSWGDNLFGQLGQGVLGSALPLNPTPATVSGLSGVTAIGAGTNHGLAISSGQVYAWGKNDKGQLGNTISLLQSQDIPIVSGQGSPLLACGTNCGPVAVTGGDSHTLVLTSAGTVVAFGDNSAGQLGQGTTSAGGPTPVAVGGLAGITGVSAKGTTSLAVDDSDANAGKVYAWGGNASGQTGQSILTNPVKTPTAVSGLKQSAVAVAEGGSHTVVDLDPLGTIAPTSLTFNSTVIGQTSAPQTVTVTNGGSSPAPLSITGVTSNSSLFTVASPSSGTSCIPAAGHTTVTLAANSSCSVTVTFAPTEATTVNATLSVASNNFTALSASLSGTGQVLQGQVSVTADEQGTTPVQHSPNTVGLGNIPFQPLSPNAQALGLPPLNIGLPPLNIGLPPLNIGLPPLNIGLPPLNIGLPPLNIGLPPLNIGLPPLNIGLPPLNIGLPALNIGLPPLNIGDLSPAMTTALSSIRLSQLPVVSVLGGWSAILANTPLAGVPLQDVTLYQALKAASALNPNPMNALTVQDLLNWGADNNTPFSSVAWLALQLGGTPVRNFTFPAGAVSMCKRLEDQGFANCGAIFTPPNGTSGLDASLFELQLGGFNAVSSSDGPLPIAALALGNASSTTGYITAVDSKSPIDQARLDLAGGSQWNAMDIGSILVKNVPNPSAILNCTGAPGATSPTVDCSSTSTVTLAQAANAGGAAGAFKSGATFAQLGSATNNFGLGEVGYGFLPPSLNPIDSWPLDPMLLGQGSGNASLVHYHVQFTPNNSGIVSNPTVSITLPADFVYLPGTVSASIGSTNCTGGLSGCSVALQTASVTSPPSTAETLTFAITGSLASGQKLTVNLTARAGWTLGVFPITAASVRAGTSTSTLSGPSAAVTVVESYGGNQDADHARPIGPDTSGNEPMIVSHIASPGQRDYFSLTLPAAAQQAGTVITVSLAHKPADLNLSVFYPAGLPTAEAPFRASGSTQTAVGDERSGANDMQTSLESDRHDDVDTGQAPSATGSCLTSNGACVPLNLVGISQNRYPQNDAVTFVSPGGVGTGTVATNPIIEVYGYNGAFSNQAFSLRVTYNAPPSHTPAARPYSFNYATTSQPAIPAGTKTIFLMAQSRWDAIYGAQAAGADCSHLTANVSQAINCLITDQIVPAGQSQSIASTIGGAIVNVDSSPAVQAAFQASDQDPFDPVKGNNVVRAINTYVDSLLKQYNVAFPQYFVVVGPYDVLPPAFPVDPEADANERNFAPELASVVGSNNSVVGALWSGRLITDDPYASSHAIALPGRYLYVPDAAVSRLVETPADVVAAVNQAMQHGLTASPQHALTTGYDFLSDSANQINSILSGKLPSSSAPAPQDTLISNTWSRQDLLNHFTNGSPVPDVVSMNGHSNFSQTLPPAATSASGLFTSQDLPAMINRLLASMGCHTGLSVPDTLLAAGASQSTKNLVDDWAQMITGTGNGGHGGLGQLAGQTGYGLGSGDGVAWTEQLMVDFAQNLGTMPVGQAMMNAKQTYYGQATPLSVYDEKTLMEASLYGLPHFSWANSTPPPAAPTVPSASIDTGTGLQSANVHLQPPNPYVRTHTNDGDYWQAPQASWTDGNGYPVNASVRFVQNRPAQPELNVDVTQAPAIGTAHGALITNMTSSDTSGWDPVLTPPTIDQAVADANHGSTPERQFGDVAWPAGLQGVRRVMSPNGPRDELSAITGRFESVTPGAGNNTTTGVEHLFSSLDLRVFYSTKSDTTPPEILQSNAQIIPATAGPSTAVWLIKADPAAGESITAVYVNYLDQNGWHQVLATRPDPTTDFYSAFASVSGNPVYIVQAVDAAGNVGGMFGKGRWLSVSNAPQTTIVPTIRGCSASSAQTPPPPPAGVTCPQPTASQPWYYNAQVLLTGSNLNGLQVSIDGGAFAPYAGGVISLTTSGHHVVLFEGFDPSTGAPVTGIISVPVDNGPTVTVAVPAANASYTLNQVVPSSFSCVDVAGAPTCTGSQTVNGTPATISSGQNIDTSTAGQHQLVVTAVDTLGLSASRTVTYNVGYNFIGYLDEVNANPSNPSFNTASAGSVVLFRWQLQDANGNYISSLSAVTNEQSYQINCTSLTGDPSTAETTTQSGNGLSFKSGNNQYQYQWATQSSWSGTCRNFFVTLDDGSIHQAYFKFS